MRRKLKRRLLFLLAIFIGALITGRWIVAPWAIKREFTAQLAKRFRGTVSNDEDELSLMAGRDTIRGLT